MKGNKFLTFVVVGLSLLAPVISSGQNPQDVLKAKAYLSKTKLLAGEVLKLAIAVDIQKKWHIHADKLGDEFLVPTALTVEAQAGLEVLDVAYPKSKLVKYDYSETALEVFEGETLFGALLRLAPDCPAGPRRLKVKLRYQACDDRSCLPPKAIEMTSDFEIVATGGQAAEDHPEVFKKITFTKLK